MTSPLQPAAQGRGNRRRALLLNIIALLLFVAAVLAAFFALPVGDVGVGRMLLAGLLVFVAVGVLGVVYVLSLRRVSLSPTPLLRASVGLVVFFVSYIVIFAYTYLSLEAVLPGEVPGLDTHIDSLYFTVTMITTVGFGDIAPSGQAARAVATAQMLVNLVLLGMVVRLSVRVGREAALARHAGGDRRHGEGSGGED